MRYASMVPQLTVLFIAVVTEQKDLVEFLIEHGANIHIRQRNGATLLHYAVEQSYFGIIECLIKHGININRRITGPGAGQHKTRMRTTRWRDRANTIVRAVRNQYVSSHVCNGVCRLGKFGLCTCRAIGKPRYSSSCAPTNGHHTCGVEASKQDTQVRWKHIHRPLNRTAQYLPKW